MMVIRSSNVIVIETEGTALPNVRDQESTDCILYTTFDNFKYIFITFAQNIK